MAHIQAEITDEKKRTFLKRLIDDGKTINEKINELIDSYLKKGVKK